MKAKLSPYVFNYKNSGTGFSYDRKAYDRWGNYMPGSVNNECYKPISGSSLISNDEFPYADQNPISANMNAGSWSLNNIKLPSGGIINVDYGAKHYAYVQNKQAMQMVTIKSTATVDGSSSFPSGILYDKSDDYYRLYLDIPSSANIKDYAKQIKDRDDYVYLLSLIHI